MTAPRTEFTNLMQPGHSTRVMAVINVSPESFYSGSIETSLEGIAKAALAAQEQGAAMLDIGAMSTAPYKETNVSPEEEKSRMVDAIEAARSLCFLPISADTQRASVAEAALDAGATIINDVSGLRKDPELADVVSSRSAGIVIMANEAGAIIEDGKSPIETINSLLEESLRVAYDAGIHRENVMLDPGFGFFRKRELQWYDFDLEILRGLKELDHFRRPILLGVSRKSFFKAALDRENAKDRLAGSLAVATLAAQRGVEWLRVHDVAETVDVIRMVNLIAGKEKIHID